MIHTITQRDREIKREKERERYRERENSRKREGGMDCINTILE